MQALGKFLLEQWIVLFEWSQFNHANVIKILESREDINQNFSWFVPWSFPRFHYFLGPKRTVDFFLITLLPQVSLHVVWINRLGSFPQGNLVQILLSQKGNGIILLQ